MKFLFYLATAILLFTPGYAQSQDQQTNIHSFKGNKSSSKQKEILLIGTFHYNNPGADVAKTKSFDIMSDRSQKELKNIASKIKDFNPSKIFVEWDYTDQKLLDSLYNLYVQDLYFKNDSLSNFYLKNEIFQLAFRAAKEINLDRVYGIDYLETSFPYEDVMNDIEKNDQKELKTELESTITKITNEFDSKIESGVTLTELTYYENSPEIRKISNKLHINTMLHVGGTNDFSGPLLTAEWYKRNLYMWSLAQKYTYESDERIMVLVGGSHAAIFELFIKENENWKIVELNEIMN